MSALLGATLLAFVALEVSGVSLHAKMTDAPETGDNTAAGAAPSPGRHLTLGQPSVPATAYQRKAGSRPQRVCSILCLASCTFADRLSRYLASDLSAAART
ncbi:hypothetical protein [Pantoea stewartii]|uniref:hypothetical protein n=1 Tax=Pantoea stewartii TaxID=66269 RepID=UPI00259FFC77|nr:hypothetical protein [Pantoea stewartii]